MNERPRPFCPPIRSFIGPMFANSIWIEVIGGASEDPQTKQVKNYPLFRFLFVTPLILRAGEEEDYPFLSVVVAPDTISDLLEKLLRIIALYEKQRGDRIPLSLDLRRIVEAMKPHLVGRIRYEGVRR
ncbi:MAG: hypothetical protein DRO00_06160 [Thermoproteota archaeon]|nr:MAG: hypothetical protein DRO00_06160 [Candidatus Korarchaeota archaeon]